MSKIYGNKVKAGDTLKIDPREGYYFVLTNVALDPQSSQAFLYTKIGGKEILIAQLNKQTGRITSINMNLQFQSGVQTKLSSKQGIVHIIGSFRQIKDNQTSKNNTNNQEMQDESQSSVPQQQQASPMMVSAPLRRSTRQRKSAVPSQNSLNSRKKKDYTLQSMAKYYNLDMKDMQQEDDDDQDQVFDKKQLQKQQSSSSSSDQEDESQKNKIQEKQNTENKVNQEQENETICDNGSNKKRKLDEYFPRKQFNKPTKNPFD